MEHPRRIEHFFRFVKEIPQLHLIPEGLLYHQLLDSGEQFARKVVSAKSMVRHRQKDKVVRFSGRE